MIVPIDHYVVIKPIDNSEFISESGIIYKNPRPSHKIGTVISLGEKSKNVQIGEVVYFVSTNTVEMDGLFIVSSLQSDNKILFNYPLILKAIKKYKDGISTNGR